MADQAPRESFEDETENRREGAPFLSKETSSAEQATSSIETHETPRDTPDDGRHPLASNDNRRQPITSPTLVDDGFAKTKTFTQPLPTRLTLVRTWWIEILALLCAALLILLIIFFLADMNGKKYPTWSYLGINVNSLVSLLITFQKAILLVPVCEVISQFKWNWFTQTRPLQHIVTLDEASRSPWSSFLLIFTFRRLNLAVIAALVFAVSVIIDPLAQQSINTKICYQDVANNSQPAQIATAHQMLVNRQTMTEGFSKATRRWSPTASTDAGLTAAILSSLGSGDNIGVQTTCSTGNCSFPLYSSLGICSSCVDQTRYIYRQNDSFTPSYVLNYTDEIYPDLSINVQNKFRESWLLNTHAYSTFAKVNTTLLRMALFDEENNPLETPLLLAASCTLHYCVQDYTASIMAGNFSEKVLSTTPLTSVALNIDQEVNPWVEDEVYEEHYPCFSDGKQYDKTNISSLPSDGKYRQLNVSTDDSSEAVSLLPSNCVFGIRQVWSLGIGVSLASRLTGKCGLANIGDQDSLECDDQPWLGTLWRAKSVSELSDQFDSIASALTIWMRNQGLTGSSNATASNVSTVERDYVQGTTQEVTLCVEFEWAWLLLPVLLTLVATALLMITISKTSSPPRGSAADAPPPWKSSPLPLLFHGLPAETPGLRPEHQMYNDQMDRRVKELSVRYKMDGDGRWGFVVASDSNLRAKGLLGDKEWEKYTALKGDNVWTKWKGKLPGNRFTS